MIMTPKEKKELISFIEGKEVMIKFCARVH